MRKETSPEFQSITAAIPSDFAAASAGYQDVRAMFAPFHGHPVSDELQIDIVQYGDVRTGVYTLPGQVHEFTAFHCHGGAFVSTPLDEYHFYAELIVRQTGCRVVMPDYRLAPEHQYPAAHNDCYNAWLGLMESGTDASKTVLLGESCGGSLAMGLMLRLRDEGLPLPGCFISLTGWFDLSVAGEPSPGRDPFLTPEWVRNRGRDYLPAQLKLDDPQVSPAYANLEGLPPLYLQIGECDAVAEGARRLAHNAGKAGVNVTVEDWPGMVQGWHGLVNAGVPEAEAAWRAIREYIAKSLGS
jgi:epsilon-lactone hydrolase